MVHASLHALGLDSRLSQVLPYIPGEVGCVRVRPVVLIYEGLRVVEVVDEVVLGNLGSGWMLNRRVAMVVRGFHIAWLTWMKVPFLTFTTRVLAN